MFSHAQMSVLMQDGATCHTARAMLDQIEQTGVKVWTDWRGNSPDLNLIEHIWALYLKNLDQRIESNSFYASHGRMGFNNSKRTLELM